MNAIISDIKRFAVHDGPGIRTTVFFKGCSMKCLWCHNPESISSAVQCAYFPGNCVNCMECIGRCNASTVKKGMHNFDFLKCNRCGKCKLICNNNAIRTYGKLMSVDDVFSIVSEDVDFYANSKGGVTLSGGECLLQVDFCEKLLKMLKESDINTAVDTCGFISKEIIERVRPYTDIFLYDIKAIDSTRHLMLTGKPNGIILENLLYLDKMNSRIEIRIPYIPECNDCEINAIGAFLSKLNNISCVRLLKYHKYAKSRYNALGMKDTLPDVLPPTEETMKNAASIIKKHGIDNVIF